MRSGFTSTRSSSLIVKLWGLTIQWLRDLLLLLQFLFLIVFIWQVCKTHVPSNNKTYLRAKSGFFKKEKERNRGHGLRGRKDNSVPINYVNSGIIKICSPSSFTEQHGSSISTFQLFSGLPPPKYEQDLTKIVYIFFKSIQTWFWKCEGFVFFSCKLVV